VAKYVYRMLIHSKVQDKNASWYVLATDGFSFPVTRSSNGPWTVVHSDPAIGNACSIF